MPVNRVFRKLLQGLGRRGVHVELTARIDRRQIQLTPQSGPPAGHVLLSYIIDPFLLKPGETISNAHTHHWESHEIAACFLRRGYAVDVVSYRNATFRPRRRYDFFIGARTNFERLARQLNPDCTKIVHLDTAHYIFNNHANYSRVRELWLRRGAVSQPSRLVEFNRGIEYADLATVLGNEFTLDTYRYAGKPMYRIPISVPAMYEWQEKDWATARRNFIWFGSRGFVHKGLDLAVEAFARLPDCHLTICGPIDQEKIFQAIYHRELYELPNIHVEGWVDVEGLRFKQILQESVGVVYPSCAEGGGGSVISCMHGGLIPLVSYEASVDTGDFGVVFENNTVDTIAAAVQKLATSPEETLRQRCRASWEWARAHHTKDRFREKYEEFLDSVLLA